MTTLDLDRLWIAPASDLADVIPLRWSSAGGTDDSRVQVQYFAQGRRRLIGPPGSSTVVVWSIPFIERSTYNVLAARAKTGAVQLVRDSRGRRIWGRVGVQFAEARHRNVVQAVTLTVTEVDVSEVV